MKRSHEARVATACAVLACMTSVLAAAVPTKVNAQTAPPLDWTLTPTQIASTCATTLAQMAQRIDGIARHAPRTFTGVVLASENAQADAADALAAATMLSAVSPDKAVRDASLACATSENDALARVSARPDLYAAMKAASESGTAKRPADVKLTALWLQSMSLSGAGLATGKRAEYLRLSDELTDLESRFGRNLADDATTIVLSRADLAGLPPDVVATFARGENGTYVVPVNESTLDVQAFAQREDVRKRYYLAYNRRAAAANVPIFERALAVRDRLAHLLGYETWAAYRLADKMARTPARVEKFLQSTGIALAPAAAADVSQMQAALDAADRTDAPLQPWDVRRGEYLLAKAHAVDRDEIRQYFPVQHTIDAILDIYHTLLGVDFAQVSPVESWAPGVLEYRVTDTATGSPLGITYFDLYPRPGKYGHFANFPILPYRAGSGRLPVAAIIGNWPRPAPGKPALLSHGDVVTFFHEFGHDMAALLATAPYETLSEGFRLDFVEAPSQMLENFVWQPEILKRVSSNWKTGEPLPDATIAALAASRKSNDAYEELRLITVSKIDMAYHTMGPRVDSTAVWASIAQTSMPLLYYPGTSPQVSFDHLMGGYDAGLYAYPWAKVYAQDLFTAFAGEHLLDPAVGMRYRTDILQPARAQEPDEEVRAFLGRPMSPDAFYAEFGVTPQP